MQKERVTLHSQTDKTGFSVPETYILSNRAGTQVLLGAFGARIISVRTRDSRGGLTNIALSLPDNDDYSASESYAGATVGPVAGRIAGGRLSILGRSFQLVQNEGSNTLHSGPHNLSHMRWDVSAADGCAAVFTQVLRDGLDGFPGNRAISVRYALDESNTLSVRYTATTDAPTFLSLTNHTYWNLSGNFSADAYGQTLEISAETVLYNDAAHLPVSRHEVRGTPFDFTSPRTVRDALASDPAHPQLAIGRGCNNTYLLTRGADFAARLTDDASGRRVTLRTDYPALVLYTGGFLPLPLRGCALALEAQFAPGDCAPLLLPDEPYERQITFQFDTLK